MIYLDWLVLVALSFVVDIAGVFIVPFAILRGGLDMKLPAWAWRWDNDREPWGDEARRPAIEAASGWRRVYLRWCWLALRNPGNNFGYSVGMLQSDVVYSYRGDTRTSDQGHYGTLFVLATKRGVPVGFCFYGIWPSWFAGKCRRVFVGWKIHDMVLDGEKAQIVCVYNPFMTFASQQ